MGEAGKYWTDPGNGLDVRPPVVMVPAEAARRMLGGDLPSDPFSAACCMVARLMVGEGGAADSFERAVALAAAEAGPSPCLLFVWAP